MAKFSLKALLGLTQRADATTSELGPSIEAAEAEVAAARAAAAQADTAYRAGLLTPNDAALRSLADARTEAGIRIDRAEAVLAALRERLDDAQDREGQAAKVSAYEEARRQADDARGALRELYPQLAADLVSLLRVVAQAEEMVQRANADLPRGAEPLEGVEASVRNVPGTPSRVISEEEVERWCWPGDQYPERLDQSAIQKGRSGWGFFMPKNNQAEYVVSRTFIETTTAEAVRTLVPERLAREIHLPGLGALDAEFWIPLENATPARVLARSEQLAEQAPYSRAPAAIKVKLTPVVPLDNEARESEREGKRYLNNMGARGTLNV